MSVALTEPSDEWHVVPCDDLREHIGSIECWCRPERDPECPDVIVHNAADGREAYETGMRRLS